MGVKVETGPGSVVTPRALALLTGVEAAALPFIPTAAALGAESASDAEGISACAAAKRLVELPLTISVKFGPPISSDVSFSTSVTSPEWKTVELFSPSLRGGGRQNSVIAGHCRTSPWWLDTTPQGQVWSAAPLKAGWR